MKHRILVGDCYDTLQYVADESVQCCVTSPPYYGMRDYKHKNQIGLEENSELYIDSLVEIFQEIKIKLKNNGTLWLNLGDSYSRPNKHGKYTSRPKDLLMIPARVAIALQKDGWYLRSDIIWSKPNPMPERTHDRPTNSHEHIFLLTKQTNYYYDAKSIQEPAITAGKERVFGKQNNDTSLDMRTKKHTGNMIIGTKVLMKEYRNIRNVWNITPKHFKEAHFATMPVELAERCIKAGSQPNDTILDPFGGAGTTSVAAEKLGRNSILCEINPDYAKIAKDRIDGFNSRI